MQVKISKSKTDQYRAIASVLVAPTNLPTCPVAMMERYYAMASLEQSSSTCAFRGIVSTKSGERLRQSGKISYTSVRELMLSKIASLGYMMEVNLACTVFVLGVLPLQLVLV